MTKPVPLTIMMVCLNSVNQLNKYYLYSIVSAPPKSDCLEIRFECPEAFRTKPDCLKSAREVARSIDVPDSHGHPFVLITTVKAALIHKMQMICPFFDHCYHKQNGCSVFYNWEDVNIREVCRSLN